MPPLPPSTTSRVLEKIAYHLPRSFCRIEIQLLSLPRTCFLLFHALDFTELLCFTEMSSFQIHHDSLVFVELLLKWGWNTFGLSWYLCLHRDAHLSALHDSLLFTEPLYLLPFHDCLVSTEPRYHSELHDCLVSTKSHYLSALPDSLFLARTPFARTALTPLFSGGTFRARFLKFMPALSRPLQHGVKP